MSEDWRKDLIHALGHTARHEREHGNHGTATGLTLIALGVIFMPIPIIGLPLLGLGIWKMCKQ